MDHKKTCFKDPSELSIHPLAKLAPEWTKDDQRFIALVENIRERGIDQRILIDREGRIVDGRNLWRAAKQLQLPEVECAVVADEDIAGTILAGLLQRRHLTKGQRAYMAYPLLESAHKEAGARRLQNLRKGQQIPEIYSVDIGKSVDAFAERLGISRPLFYQAAEVHKLLANNKKFDWNDERKPLTLREYYEPRILDDEDAVGLGAVIAGIGSKLSGKTQDQNKVGQLELFTDAFDTLKTRFGYWGKFSSAQKAALDPVIEMTVAEMPFDLCERFVKAAKQRLKEATA